MKKDDFGNEMHIEFLKALHDEKVKTQSERANYITSKFAFITGLFGLGALQIGEMNFIMLLYFIPVLAIGYDLYIRAADLSIKKIGAFLRSDPLARTTDAEKAWETFSSRHRDKLAHLANMIFSYVIIFAAAASIFALQGEKNRIFSIWFSLWLLLSTFSNTLLWRAHRKEIKNLDAPAKNSGETESTHIASTDEA